MMTVTPDQLSALSANNFKYAWLIELPDAIRLTTYHDDLSIGSNTFISSPYIKNIPSISRTKGIQVQDVSLTFSGEDKALENILLSRNMTGEDVWIRLALLDQNGDVISGQAIDIYKGHFDGWSLSENNKNSQVTINIASSWSKANKMAGRLTNPSDQQALYPGDAFFDFAHEQIEHLGWGGEA